MASFIVKKSITQWNWFTFVFTEHWYTSHTQDFISKANNHQGQV